MVSRLAIVLVAGAGLTTSAAAESLADYRADIERWHEARIERLKRPDGWLSLYGLDWIDAGSHVVGSAREAAVRLPNDAPARVGVLSVTDSGITFTPEPGVNVADGMGPIVGERTLDTDATGDPTILALDHVRFYVIERGERLAVRVKDLEHPRRLRFTGIDRYPVDPAWRVSARLIERDVPATVSVPDVTGAVTEQPSPGVLRFTLAGTEQELTALEDGDAFFLVFGDETNGLATYGGGRFLVTSEPDSAGIVLIDFNRAYNPPCVFSPFATCPLPPEGNRLAVAVEAGERVDPDASHGGE